MEFKKESFFFNFIIFPSTALKFLKRTKIIKQHKLKKHSKYNDQF